jgi:drug/metabolite transporter (DMT)-like permease
MRIDPAHGRAPSRAAVTLAISLLMTVWAVNFLVVKIGIRYLPVVAFASFRIVAAALFMILIAPFCARLSIFREPQVSPCSGRTLDRPCSSAPFAGQGRTWRDYWTFAYLGFFGVSLNQFFFSLALRYTNVTHSSIIVGIGPINTLILAILFRLERATIRKALGMLVALAGVVILATGSGVSRHSPTLLGDVLTLIGSLAFAMYVVLGKRVAGNYNPLTMTTWNFVCGGLLLLPVAIHSAIALGPLSNWRTIPWQAWACIFYTGLFSSTLAYLFYFWLLGFLEASQLAAFSYLLPVSASALGILFLGERGSWTELLGGALALLGLYWIESTRSR